MKTDGGSCIGGGRKRRQQGKREGRNTSCSTFFHANVFLALEIVISNNLHLVYLVFGMVYLVKTDGGGRKRGQQGLEGRERAKRGAVPPNPVG